MSIINHHYELSYVIKCIAQDQDEVDAEDDSEDEDALDTGLDYDYLLGMPMWSLTKERKDDLIKKKEVRC